MDEIPLEVVGLLRGGHYALAVGLALAFGIGPIVRFVQFVLHVRFIRSATPDQLAAYQGHVPPPKPPTLAGPLVALLYLGGLSLATGHATEQWARQEQPVSVSPPSAIGAEARDCCRDGCEPPSKCVRCKCQADTRKPPPKKQGSPPVSDLASIRWRDPLWHREQPEG